MKQGKIGVEWLAQLSKEEQILFCKNRVNFGRNLSSSRSNLTIAQYLNDRFYSFSQFIDHGFVWTDTPEGQDYWASISRRPSR